MAALPAEQLKEFKETLKGASVKVVGSEIDEEAGTGTVSLELTSPDGKTNTVECDVVKEDGSWKAEFSK